MLVIVLVLVEVAELSAAVFAEGAVLDALYPALNAVFTKLSASVWAVVEVGEFRCVPYQAPPAIARTMSNAKKARMAASIKLLNQRCKVALRNKSNCNSRKNGSRKKSKAF